jgi:hypothetical protein
LDEGATWYIFVLAIQNPKKVYFLPAQRELGALPFLDASYSEEERSIQMANYHLHRFAVPNQLEHLRHDELPIPPLAAMFVAQGLAFQQDGSLVGDMEPAPLEDWVAQWPAIVGPERGESSRVPQSAIEDAMTDHPWIAEYLGNRAPHRGGFGGGGVDIALPDAIDDADALANAWESLEAEYVGLDAVPAAGDEFFVRLRGEAVAIADGAAEPLHGSVGAEAKRGLPRDYCQRYRLSEEWLIENGERGI